MSLMYQTFTVHVRAHCGQPLRAVCSKPFLVPATPSVAVTSVVVDEIPGELASKHHLALLTANVTGKTTRDVVAQLHADKAPHWQPLAVAQEFGANVGISQQLEIAVVDRIGGAPIVLREDADFTVSVTIRVASPAAN